MAQDVIITRPTPKKQTQTAKPKPKPKTTPKKQQVTQRQEVQQAPVIDRPIITETFIANGVSFKMILIEGNGSPYYIGETEVTQALWQAVMGDNPSIFKGDNLPVEYVSWDECQTFISKLNSITGKNFRLPKESEWEYAAKGGFKSHGYTYSGSNTVEEVAWYDNNARSFGSNTADSSRPDYGPHPVKTKYPNELGIYDMSGNVFEWCEDFYYPTGPRRVNRGGGWNNTAWCCTVGSRHDGDPDRHDSAIGLRLAL